jgi:hypothetical protein
MTIDQTEGNALDGWRLTISCDHEEYVAIYNLRVELYRNRVLLERVKKTGKVDL